MNRLFEKIEMKKLIVMFCIMQVMLAFPAYADVLAEVKKTKLYTGLVDIGNAVILGLIGIEVLLTCVLVLTQMVQLQTADDQKKPQIKEKIKSTIMIGLVAASFTAIIKIAFNAFGVKDETNSKALSMLLFNCYQLF